MAQAAAWAWYLVQPGGAVYVGSLVSARSRKLSWQLDGAATASFTMPGGHPETAAIVDLGTDLVATRDGRNVFRGRIQASADAYGADSDAVNFTAIDYRGLLGRRLFWASSTLSFRGVDQANIAWQMIADTQAEPGGNLAVTRGAAPTTGVLRDRDYEAGKPVGEALTQLGDVVGGFDWEIDGNLAFNLYYPQRGRATGLVLYWGRDITALGRQQDPSKYANAIFYSGGNGTLPVRSEVSSFPPGIGRWDAAKADPNLVLQQTVTDRAAYELALASDITAAFTITMADGGWDPAALWVGDQARIIADTGRINVDTTRRILQIDCTLTDDGGESVALTLGDSTSTLSGRLQSYQSRIAALERATGYIPDTPVGTVLDYAGTTAPSLFAFADGSALNTGQYPELFAVIGYTYGGAGASFNLPDCRGRMTLAVSSAHAAGSTGGAETVALSQTQTGSHVHNWSATSTTQSADHAHAYSATSTVNNVDHTHNQQGTTDVDSPDHGHTFGIQATAQAGSTAWQPTNTPTVQQPTTGSSARHLHALSGPTTGGSQAHQHSISGNTATTSANHQHNVSGVTDNGGTTGAAHQNMPPFIAINKIIKVMSAQAAGSS
jgi:microcystin-dependent protein